MADDLTVTRMGYGAMQLAGPHVFGPPADRDAAVAVLREAVELGITHIDTADFYGPYVTNQIIRQALHPYPEDLHIVTKVGAARDAEGGWPHARAPEQLREQVHGNLRNLDARRPGRRQPARRRLRQSGARARSPSPSRRWPRCSARASSAIWASAPSTPSRSLRRSRSRPSYASRTSTTSPTARTTTLIDVARRAGTSPTCRTSRWEASRRCSPTRWRRWRHVSRPPPMAVALAWLLQRSPNMLLIPGHLVGGAPARERHRGRAPDPRGRAGRAQRDLGRSMRSAPRRSWLGARAVVALLAVGDAAVGAVGDPGAVVGGAVLGHRLPPVHPVCVRVVV